jgi:hypothetical protein
LLRDEPLAVLANIARRRTRLTPRQLVNAQDRESFGAAEIGSIAVGNTAAIRPSRPIRYLWKFQRGVSSGRSAAAHL